MKEIIIKKAENLKKEVKFTYNIKAGLGKEVKGRNKFLDIKK